MLSKKLLTSDQNKAIDKAFENDATLLVGDMGVGKTIISLTTVQELLAVGFISRVLVVAPLKVANTRWQQECANWQHTSGLTVGIATGAPKKRMAALTDLNNDVVVINFENLAWFCKTFKDSHGFDGLVIDELTKLKESGGTAFKKLRHRLHAFKWRLGLTGTPVSENFESLYAMCMVLDSGARLGTRKDVFMRKYFYPTDYNEYNWELLDGTGATLLKAVDDLIHVIDTTVYQAELPPFVFHPIKIELDVKSRLAYQALKQDSVLDMEGGGVLTADNAAVLTGKLQQLANGFLYDEDGSGGFATCLHTLKIDECVRLVKKINAPVIISYWYKEDLKRLKAAFKKGIHLDGKNDDLVMSAWNRGAIDVLFIHPLAAGHGIELQHGGSDFIFYSPIWSRDQKMQVMGRVRRKGQKADKVDVYTLLASDTVDELIDERVEGKASYEELLLTHFGLG